VLEDRTVLSTLTVLNANDSGPGSLRAVLGAAANGRRRQRRTGRGRRRLRPRHLHPDALTVIKKNHASTSNDNLFP
jgi:hypothetical protein